MNRLWTQLLLSVITLFATNGSARAAIISRDFRAPGDGLLTYDCVNNREWLDLSETDGTPLSDVQQTLLPDGTLFGFRIATATDVRSLATSAGFPASGTDFGKSYTSIANNFVDLLSETMTYSVTFQTWDPSGSSPWQFPNPTLYSRFSHAFAESGSSGTFAPFAIAATSTAPYGPPDFAGSGAYSAFAGILNSSDPIFLQYLGVWLYRDAPIPEPSVMTLLAIAAALSPLRLRAFA